MQSPPVELRKSSGERTAPLERTRGQVDESTRGGRKILCAACSHPITTEKARIEVGGRHEHHCVNPHGYEFHVGCFRHAPGCRGTGAPTLEFTWFPGFAWRYAVCGGCNELLGWRYDGAEANSFYGLILDRLAIS